MCQVTVVEMWYTMVSEVVRELLGFLWDADDSSWGSSDLRSSDLPSRAAPRCLFCAWSSHFSLKCLFSTFLSTSLDDFEALGANFSALGAILDPLGVHSRMNFGILSQASTIDGVESFPNAALIVSK